jgi:hypothetical protein
VTPLVPAWGASPSSPKPALPPRLSPTHHRGQPPVGQTLTLPHSLSPTHHREQDREEEAHAPIMWRKPFPSHIQATLVSWDKSTGTITNSDLELAATIAQQDVLVNTFDLRERTIHTGSDNIPAVYWQRKGSTTTTKARQGFSVSRPFTKGISALAPSSPTSLGCERYGG